MLLEESKLRLTDPVSRFIPEFKNMKVAVPKRGSGVAAAAAGGVVAAGRYLSPRTIELMASNHTGEMAGGQMGMSPRGIGFGLGVQVVNDPVAADRRVSRGAWGWAGAYGTNVHVEPQEDGDHHPDADITPALQRDFENAVFQAIAK